MVFVEIDIATGLDCTDGVSAADETVVIDGDEAIDDRSFVDLMDLLH